MKSGIPKKQAFSHFDAPNIDNAPLFVNSPRGVCAEYHAGGLRGFYGLHGSSIACYTFSRISERPEGRSWVAGLFLIPTLKGRVIESGHGGRVNIPPSGGPASQCLPAQNRVTQSFTVGLRHSTAFVGRGFMPLASRERSFWLRSGYARLRVAAIVAFPSLKGSGQVRPAESSQDHTPRGTHLPLL